MIDGKSKCQVPYVLNDSKDLVPDGVQYVVGIELPGASKRNPKAAQVRDSLYQQNTKPSPSWEECRTLHCRTGWTREVIYSFKGALDVSKSPWALGAGAYIYRDNRAGTHGFVPNPTTRLLENTIL